MIMNFMINYLSTKWKIQKKEKSPLSGGIMEGLIEGCLVNPQFDVFIEYVGYSMETGKYHLRMHMRLIIYSGVEN
jgi:hypothetical protein